MEVTNEFEVLLGKRREVPLTSFIDAEGKLRDGFRYFVGEGYKWLDEYKGVSAWMECNNRKGLLLYGSNGRGKSIICKYILPTLFACYYKGLKLFSCRANELRGLKPDANEYFTMRMADVEFVDDFGVEGVMNNYGEKIDVFSDIVDIAEHERKLLICSTNLVPSEIRQKYGLRTLDRLMALTTPVCFLGDSMRVKR